MTAPVTRGPGSAILSMTTTITENTFQYLDDTAITIDIEDLDSEGTLTNNVTVTGNDAVWVSSYPIYLSLTYLDAEGEPRERIAEGFLATVCQHEFDHLDGVLYVDKVQDPGKLAFLEEYARYHAG